jgi:hypothetical protein
MNDVYQERHGATGGESHPALKEHGFSCATTASWKPRPDDDLFDRETRWIGLNVGLKLQPVSAANGPGFASDEEFLERVPVMAVPAPVQGVVFAGGEAGVVEDQRGLGGAGFELEVNDRVDAGIPMGWPPCLHDPLVEDQFDIAANDEAAELREGSSRRRVNCGGHAAEGSELLLVEDGFVEPLRAGMKVDLVMDGSERPVSRVGGLLGHGWLLRAQGRQRGYSQRCGDGGEGAAAGRRGD